MTTGTVYLVGAGPGDPGLLTIRARELLQSCDDVVYDALVNEEMLSAELGGRDVARHFVGKRGGDSASARQGDIERLLVRLAREGRRVVRLKGGDPFVFGRGGEEAQVLADAGIPFEIVPGITAGVAGPAYAGIPVTHRGAATAVTLVTGHEDPDKGERGTDWRALARTNATLVLYMGVRTLPEVVRELLAGGRSADTPAAVIERATYPAQRVIMGTLATIADRAREASVGAPAITIVGDVVGLRDEIEWFDRRPLAGARIVVTRARAQASSLSARLRELGADVIEMPAIRVEPLDTGPLDRALAVVPEYDWMIFTSQNAVEVVWGAMRARGLDARTLGGVRIAAIGRATADALLDHGMAADVVPQRFVAESLVEALETRDDVSGRRVLLPRAADARDVLPDGLRALGAEVDVVPIYRTVMDGEGAARVAARLTAGDVDLVTLTSSSTARYFVDAVGADAARAAPVASIGPVTSAAARALGLRVAVEAEESTIAGLIAALTTLRR
ncbi:MAG TPA: uroporphyrinogen-III C-methyltransferase [Candidatus Limnocylindria bacterium]|nr:uroporphyrinogen-III C-methyltransferase [Candidatus Limnocylindria bacterium]